MIEVPAFERLPPSDSRGGGQLHVHGADEFSLRVDGPPFHRHVPGYAAPIAPDTSTGITLHVDGTQHDVRVDNRITLLDLLREHLGVTAPKKGCDHDPCGSCTVLLDEVKAGAPSHVTDDLAPPRLVDAEIRERMSGNLCRCAVYPTIVAAA